MKKSDKLSLILRGQENATIQNGAICFLPGNRLPRQTAGTGLLGAIQDRLKTYGILYRLCRNIIKPVFADPAYRARCREIVRSYSVDHTVIHLGSGPTHYLNRKDIINVDIFAFKEVDVVADGSQLPIADESTDLVMSFAVLEHTKHPDAIIEEMYRITKTGGRVICYVPFLVPFHAAPDDFHRWTAAGALQLFNRFTDTEIMVGGGPTSALLWMVQEWLATIISLGNKTFHDVILLLLMILLAPVKLLDWALVKIPGTDKIASGFCVFAKK